MYDVWLAFSIVIYVVGRCLFVEVLQIVSRSKNICSPFSTWFFINMNLQTLHDVSYCGTECAVDCCHCHLIDTAVIYSTIPLFINIFDHCIEFNVALSSPQTGHGYVDVLPASWSDSRNINPCPFIKFKSFRRWSGVRRLRFKKLLALQLLAT